VGTKVFIAQPRGFCAGVVRAIDAVTASIEKFGAPVYVRKQLVHNNSVTDALSASGAIFVDELDHLPEGATVILSAHGVAPEVYEDARRRRLNVIDATCPLVTKVHLEATRYAREGRPIVIVGHRGHEEVIGTLGYASADADVVPDIAAVERLELPVGAAPAVITQTTLAVDDTRDTIEAIRRRFPAVITPAHDDICYATQNRQAAVRELARSTQVILVIGAANSSNSNRLREVAEAAGVRAYLIADLSELRTEWLHGVDSIGVTAGASTPEHLVDEVVSYLRSRYDASVETIEVTRENVTFSTPTPVTRFKRSRPQQAAAQESVVRVPAESKEGAVLTEEGVRDGRRTQ
jgi:4-hydroxy-3-methylbut-2-enyl diphosphate reductase